MACGQDHMHASLFSPFIYLSIHFFTIPYVFLVYSITIGHSVSFAQQLTAVLTAHCDVIQQHKLNCYLNSVHR